MSTHLEWYVHSQGLTVGPLLSETISLLLEQGRLHPVEFVWRNGFKNWMRICEVPEFQNHAPAYPSAPLPVTEEYMATQITSRQESPVVTPVVSPKVRRYKRVPIDGFVEIEDHGTFDLLNISENGVFVICNSPPPIQTEIRFKIESRVFGVPLDMRGVVVRHASTEEGESGFGVEFVDVNPAYRGILQSYIRNSN